MTIRKTSVEGRKLFRLKAVAFSLYAFLAFAGIVVGMLKLRAGCVWWQAWWLSALLWGTFISAFGLGHEIGGIDGKLEAEKPKVKRADPFEAQKEFVGEEEYQ